MQDALVRTFSGPRMHVCSDLVHEREPVVIWCLVHQHHFGASSHGSCDLVHERVPVGWLVHKRELGVPTTLWYFKGSLGARTALLMHLCACTVPLVHQRHTCQHKVHARHAFDSHARKGLMHERDIRAPSVLCVLCCMLHRNTLIVGAPTARISLHSFILVRQHAFPPQHLSC